MSGPAVLVTIERCTTVENLILVKNVLRDDPRFRLADKNVRRNWAAKLDARVEELIREAMTPAEINFIVNATFTNHLWQTDAGAKARWREAATTRNHELNMSLIPERTDAERAAFALKLPNEDVILLPSQARFIANNAQVLQLAVAGKTELSVEMRTALDALYTKFKGEV